MISRLEHDGIVWVDLDRPTPEEIQTIAKEFKIHSLVADELYAPSERSKVDPYDDYTYLIFHFPSCIKGSGKCEEREIDFVLGKKFLITTHYETENAIIEFAKKFEVNAELRKRKLSHAGYVFYYLMIEMYAGVKRDIRLVSYQLSEIEHQIFTGQERQMVINLSLASRNIIDFKRAIRHHEGLLDSFEKIANSFFNNHFNYYLDDLDGEYGKIKNLLDATKETLVELRETNDSLVSTKMNEIMKNLTIMAFVTFPLSLIAAIFGMNTVQMPIVGHPFDFWLIVGVMLISVIYMYSYFKYRKWI
ncbi:MAG: magnesium transporter CorA family protein [bacterium]|nr:magnesium transporter CorA family protein [bacterium]